MSGFETSTSVLETSTSGFETSTSVFETSTSGFIYICSGSQGEFYETTPEFIG